MITGGTGLVGQALKKLVPEAAFVSSRDFDLTKENEVKALFEKYRPERVIHLAARVGGILDNMSCQAEYFYQNVLLNTFTIHYADKYGVKRLIGLGSNCAYPDIVATYPIKEEDLHAGPPAITNFSYACAKRALVAQILAYRTQYGRDYFSVIPCNLYGPNDKFGDKDSHFVAALIKKIHNARLKGERTIKLLGSGKPLRQFMYADDLAKVLLLLLDQYRGAGPLNIAPLENYSIREIAEIALQATGNSELKLEFDGTSPDGQFRKDISCEKLRGILGNLKITPLSEGLKQTYEWYIKNEK